MKELFRILMGFAMTTSLVFIFYLFIKRIGQGWKVLIAMAGIMAFALLALQDKITGQITTMNLWMYLSGVLLSNFVLAVLFFLKTRWLFDPPEDDVFLGGDGLDRRIHLRRVLQAAVLLEEKGEAFYRKLARKVNSSEVAQACERLAHDEGNHRKLIEQTLSQWLAFRKDKEFFDFLNEEGIPLAKIFGGALADNVSEKDMVRCAIEQEKASVDFYRSLEKSFPKAWKKMQIENLVLEEKAHQNTLEHYLEKLKRIPIKQSNTRRLN